MRLFPTPEPGEIPVSQIWTVQPSRNAARGERVNHNNRDRLYYLADTFYHLAAFNPGLPKHSGIKTTVGRRFSSPALLLNSP